MYKALKAVQRSYSRAPLRQFVLSQRQFKNAQQGAAYTALPTGMGMDWRTGETHTSKIRKA